jgi:hypothetical protein
MLLKQQLSVRAHKFFSCISCSKLGCASLAQNHQKLIRPSLATSQQEQKTNKELSDAIVHVSVCAIKGRNDTFFEWKKWAIIKSNKFKVDLAHTKTPAVHFGFSLSLPLVRLPHCVGWLPGRERANECTIQFTIHYAA